LKGSKHQKRKEKLKRDEKLKIFKQKNSSFAENKETSPPASEEQEAAQ
jgi:hypothetical protein